MEGEVQIVDVHKSFLWARKRARKANIDGVTGQVHCVTSYVTMLLSRDPFLEYWTSRKGTLNGKQTVDGKLRS